MNIKLKKKSLFSILFFIVMAGYALLRELRDSVFIYLVGLSSLPKVKIISLFFLFIELLFYQRLIDYFKPKQTYLFFSLLYGFLLFFFGISFVYLPLVIPSIFGYFFYIILEGYVPFVWSLLWALFTAENINKEIKNDYLFISVFAQMGGFVFSFLFYCLIKKNLFSSTKLLFGAIMLTSAGLLFITSILTRYFSHNIEKEEEQNSQSKKNYQKLSFDKNIIFEWWHSFKKIISSLYVFGIFLIIFCWEIINITLNYFRLDLFLEKSIAQSTYLLQDLYYSISLTYLLGIFIAIVGSSFLVKHFGVKKTLLAFPILLIISVIPLLLFNNNNFLILFYMIIKGLYPALIFPIKESLYLVTSHEIRFKSKLWIDGLGSRFSKAFASFYIQLTFLFLPEKRYLVHLCFFSFILFIFLWITYYVVNLWENKMKTKEIIE